MTTLPPKIGAYVPGLTDEEARERNVLAEYQEMAIRQAVTDTSGGTLIADDMGAGKTVQAVEIALRLNLPRVLIVAPRNALKQWAERFASQSDGAVAVRKMDSTKAGLAAFEDFLAGAPGYYSSNTQWLTRQDFSYSPAVNELGQPIYKVKKSTGEVILKDGEPVQETLREHLARYVGMKPVDVFIFDEFHAIQNRNAITKRSIYTIRANRRIGLSGTWHGNNFSGAYSTSRWVWPGKGANGEYVIDRSYHRWLEQWAELKRACPKCFADVPDADATTCVNCYLTFTQSKRPIQTVVGEKVPGEFVKTLPLYLRRTPFPEIPQPKVVYVDITPAQLAQYRQLEEEMIAWVRDHEGVEQPIVADLTITQRQRLRTATLGEMSGNVDGEIWFADDCSSAKLTALRGILDEWSREAGRTEPVLIFTDSKPFAKVTAKRMQAAGYRARAWHGDLSQAVRDQMKEDFIAGEFDYLVATIQSLNEAVDGLQWRCSKMLVLSRVENELMFSQGLRRIWRPGVNQKAFEWAEILARDTLDEGTFSRTTRTRVRNLAQMAI